MRLEELRKSFRGYREDDVFRYLTELENNYTRRLSEQEERLSREAGEALERIQQLESENRTLREELSRLQEQRDQISQAILDARASAEAMVAESRAREDSAREAVQKSLKRDLSELELYKARISALRGSICDVLEGLRQQSEELIQRLAELEDDSPAGNLILFR